MGSLENPIFRVGGWGVVVLVTKKTLYRVELPKTGGAWTVCRFKGGGLTKKRAMYFM